MIRYTVVWHQLAQDQLTRIWVDATDRKSVTEAANTVDTYLAVDPDLKGTLIDDDENIRELIQRPLRVLYSVSDDDRLVRILAAASV